MKTNAQWEPVIKHGNPVKHLYIRQPSGTYYARLYANGRNKYVNLGTTVYTLARSKLAEALAAHTTAWTIASDARDGSLTVGQLATLFLQQVDTDTGIRESTKHYKRDCVQRLFTIYPELRDTRPGQVDTAELQQRFAAGAEHYAAPGFNGTIDSTRAIFKLAVDRGLIFRNPADSLSKKSVQQKRMTLPTSEQFKAIVEALRSSDSITAQADADLVEFLAYSGLRIEEARQVTWDDVDFDKCQIYVKPSKSDHDRYVPMLADARRLLHDIQSVPRFSRSARREGNFVLASREVYDELAAACRKVGAPHITHHDLRHLFATRCIESGVDIPTVSRWLGHLDGGILAMRIYGHLRQEHSREMAAKVSF